MRALGPDGAAGFGKAAGSTTGRSTPPAAGRRSPCGDLDDGSGLIGVGRAHGKAILLGEHAVVYGAPALAIPVPQLEATAKATRSLPPGEGPEAISFIPQGPASPPASLTEDSLRNLVEAFKETTGVDARIQIEVSLDCEIPRGRGLGSSAACARAAVLALADLFGRRLDPHTVFDLVQVAENMAHGRASGIDAAATGSTSVILFQTGEGTGLGTPLQWGRLGGLFVIADSGVASNTKDAVELLRHRFECDTETKTTFVRQVTQLTHAAVRDLAGGRLGDFGGRLTANHDLLRKVGLSTDRTDALVDAALRAGGLGAKISGSGLGGCVVALAADPHGAGAVVRGLHEAGAVRTWIVSAERISSHVA